MPAPVLLLVAAAFCACGGPPDGGGDGRSVPDEARRFVADRAFRRSTLETQLVSTVNAYAYERLAAYAIESDDGAPAGWDALPLEPLAAAAGWPDGPEELPGSEAEFLALGRRAFLTYPARVGAEFVPAFRAAWPHVRMAADGSPRAEVRCAACHARGGDLGAASPDFDAGASYAEAFGDAVGPEERAVLRSWGPGRLDLTADTADDPLQIPDLRPLRHQRLLNAAGAVRHRGPTDLAVRIDTLLVTASGRRTRGARATVAALAWWLETLAPPGDPGGAAEPPEVFTVRCARCHDPATGYASTVPIPAAEVGTDPAAAWSPGRGTGGYRAPSLALVRERRPLLHDGSVRDLSTLLSPARTEGGHLFAAGLDREGAARLIAFVEGL